MGQRHWKQRRSAFVDRKLPQRQDAHWPSMPSTPNKNPRNLNVICEGAIWLGCAHSFLKLKQRLVHIIFSTDVSRNLVSYEFFEAEDDLCSLSTGRRGEVEWVARYYAPLPEAVAQKMQKEPKEKNICRRLEQQPWSHLAQATAPFWKPCVGSSQAELYFHIFRPRNAPRKRVKLNMRTN